MTKPDWADQKAQEVIHDDSCGSCEAIAKALRSERASADGSFYVNLLKAIREDEKQTQEYDARLIKILQGLERRIAALELNSATRQNTL